MEGGDKEKNNVTAATTAVSFDTLELSEPTRNALKELGFANMTEIQVIQSLL
jgi:superfamily II DNA/RNA helicase